MSKIIIVEDDEILLKNISGYIEIEGFYVKATASGSEFFKELKMDKFDIAIVDLGLPDASGLEIVEYLRENTELGIIIITANDSLNDRINGYNAGADTYFLKPLDCNELACVVKNLSQRIKNQNSNNSKWHIAKENRTLVSPNNKGINLTSKEYDFINLLLNLKDSFASHKDLIKNLGYNLNHDSGKHSLDMLVMRLRKKIKETTNEESPIITVHSHGYSFQ